MNKYIKIIGEKTGFMDMYNGIELNVEAAKDLLEVYLNTTNEQKKMALANQLATKLGIKLTEKNYKNFMKYTSGYLAGLEQGFINIINMAGVAAGTLVNAYAAMHEKTLEEIKALGKEYTDFMLLMLDAKYAYVDQNGRFKFGTQELKDIANDKKEKDEGEEEEEEKWENSYDWLYNANQAVNAQIRLRNKLEKEYTRMVEDNIGTVDDLAQSLEAQVVALDKEASMLKQIYDNAKLELVGLINSGPYLQYLKDAIAVGSNGLIAVDKEKLYSAGYTADEGGIVEDMIGKVESLVDTMKSAEDALEDNYDALRELKKTGKDEYTNLLDRVTDALRNQYQKEIDNLSSINDAINNAAEALVSKIQEKINDDRLAREDEKTLQNLKDKQTRLAYLQASGGSQLDILKLLKEIDNDTESYLDKLVDKTINEMQKANLEAADQRQQLIDIALAQYDWWSKNAASKEGEAMLNASLKEIAHGTNPLQSLVGALLAGNDNIEAQSKSALQEWENELSNSGKLATIYANNTAILQGDSSASLYSLLTTLHNTESDIKKQLDNVKENMNTISLGNADLLTNANMALSTSELSNKILGFTEAIIALQNKDKPGDTDTDTDYDGSKDDGHDTEGDKNPTNTTEEAEDTTKYHGVAWDKSIKSKYDVGYSITNPKLKDALNAARSANNNAQALSGDLNDNLVYVYDEASGRWTAYTKRAELKKDAANTTGSLTEIKTKTYNPNVPEVIEGAGIEGYGEGFLWWDKNRATNDIDVTMDGRTYDLLLGNAAPSTILDALNNAIASKTEAETLVLFRNLLFLYGKDKLWHLMGSDTDSIESAVWGAKTLRGYATGGLADFTGPAWLDGTKSAPELVLNATDTANFIALKDILSEIMRGAHNNATDKSAGNNYYDIDVHVDSIESDYDVDQAVDRMRELIEEDAMYRNVTAINKTR